MLRANAVCRFEFFGLRGSSIYNFRGITFPLRLPVHAAKKVQFSESRIALTKAVA